MIINDNHFSYVLVSIDTKTNTLMYHKNALNPLLDIIILEDNGYDITIHEYYININDLIDDYVENKSNELSINSTIIYDINRYKKVSNIDVLNARKRDKKMRLRKIMRSIAFILLALLGVKKVISILENSKKCNEYKEVNENSKAIHKEEKKTKRDELRKGGG